jgi:carbamoyltransferase
MANELDVLVVGNCVLQKAEQDPALKSDYSLSLDAD